MVKQLAFAERLALYEEQTRAGMTSYLRPELDAGYLYPLMREYPCRPGKGLRPALLLATCEAFGGSARTALPVAISLELMHNAFLVHDDVEDESPLRRGGPTVHEKYDVALAINAGDGLVHVSLEPLLAGGLPAPLLRVVTDELRTAVRHTVEGQALELGWRAEGVVDLAPADYLTLAAKKTSWYTTVAPLRLGALIATGGSVAPERLELLSRMGFHLGIAFQLRDDLLDLDVLASTGKVPMTDVVEGKRTLMLVHLLGAADPTDRRWVQELLARPRPERTLEDGQRLVALYDRYGSTKYAALVADELEAVALEQQARAFDGAASPAHSAFVRELAASMTRRGL